MDVYPVAIALAIILDYVFGDPNYRFHPVRLMGQLSQRLEGAFRRAGVTGILSGCAFAVIHPGICVCTYLAVRYGSSQIHPLLVILFDTYCFYSMYAHTDLLKHAHAVYVALRDNAVSRAQRNVAMMVGRETDILDTAGIGRAAIESVAENFVDGSLGIFFWTAIALVFATNIQVNASAAVVVSAIIYRSINTLDAMVGYRNARYIRFGKFSARLDDVLNYIPARFSMLLLLLARPFPEPLMNGLRAWLKYQRCTASPNSGHPESVMAGLLNVRLGGPAYYHGELTDHGWIWESGNDVAPEDIQRCIRLVATANLIGVVSVLLVMVVVFH